MVRKTPAFVSSDFTKNVYALTYNPKYFYGSGIITCGRAAISDHSVFSAFIAERQPCHSGSALVCPPAPDHSRIAHLT